MAFAARVRAQAREMNVIRVGPPRSLEGGDRAAVTAPIEVGDARYDVWYRVSEGPIAPGGETFLAATLPAAMRLGFGLEVAAGGIAPADERVADNRDDSAVLGSRMPGDPGARGSLVAFAGRSIGTTAGAARNASLRWSACAAPARWVSAQPFPQFSISRRSGVCRRWTRPTGWTSGRSCGAWKTPGGTRSLPRRCARGSSAGSIAGLAAVAAALSRKCAGWPGTVSTGSNLATPERVAHGGGRSQVRRSANS